ncbi:hypothetical protein COOONC_13870 [Cooperia oncophora]
MNATSSMYIEQMYSAWKADPKSVHASWDAYFRNVEGGAAPGQAYQAPPTAYGAVGVPGVLPLIPRGSSRRRIHHPVLPVAHSSSVQGVQNDVEEGNYPCSSLGPKTLHFIPLLLIPLKPQMMPSPSKVPATGLDSSVQAISDHLKVQLLIRSYQTRGHNIADLDPLGINSA